ncbi:MAG TPA: cellulose synthase operon protein YhjQ/BcsQ [Acidobacteriaceae bacterium]|jgi:cellulose biosynthesis protein BcsQ|nr:cellulose synthase operon protein YhjQ/BcsQ [Acidobacteriaceae bacterium]
MHSDDKLAKDVARLYSWANVEDAPYRDFSRQRRPTRAVETPERVAETGSSEGNGAGASSGADAAGMAVSRAEEAGLPAFREEAGELHRNSVMRPITAVEQNLPVPSPSVGPSVGLAVGAAPAVAFPAPGQFTTADAREFHPVLSVYSIAGGVGKTTLCANLGRALYSIGDRVLLVDASGSGLLPFYFGANDLSPGVHTFFVPGIQRPPLRIIGADEITPEWLNTDVRREMDSSYWTVFDLGAGSASLLPQILNMSSFLLIPLLPDLNSILTVSRVESTLEAMRARGSEIPSPFYIFNQFDEANPIDQGARDLILRQCGGRLLPTSIRHDPEAAAAIAARRTVIDHAPGSEIASASMKLAALFQRAVTVSRNRRSSSRWDES